MLEEVCQNLLLDVVRLHSVCHAALLHHLGREGREVDEKRTVERGGEGDKGGGSGGDIQIYKTKKHKICNKM